MYINIIICLIAFFLAYLCKKFEYKYPYFQYLFHFFLAIGFIQFFKIIFFLIRIN